MALRFVDGFDHYAIADMGKKYDTVGVTTALTTGRFGGQAWYGWNWVTSQLRGAAKTFDNQTTWVLGAAVNTFLAPSAAPDVFAIFTVIDGSTAQLILRWNEDGTVSVLRGATILATSTEVLPAAWSFLEFKCTIHASAGAYEVRLNGIPIIGPTTGANTANTANNYANRISLANILLSSSPLNPDNAYFLWDDYYILDGTDGTAAQGAANNDFLGDCRVTTLYPNAPGTYEEFTTAVGSGVGGHYANVDETLMDSDTTYNAASGVNLKESFNFQDISSTSDIRGVQINLANKIDNAGSKTFKPLTKLGATEELGDVIAPGASYVITSQLLEKDPDGNVWTASNVNSAEFGYESIT